MIPSTGLAGTLASGAGVEAYTLRGAGGLRLQFLSLGGIITSLMVPDARGEVADVVLGYDELDSYLADPRYFGAIVGRYANRIAGSRFTIGSRDHTLSANEGRNQLHGGPVGFNRAVWSVALAADGASAVLTHVSRDGDQGYPGALEVSVTYTLTDRNELAIDYRAECDAATHVNLTQHSYFNLRGHDAGTILDHELTLHASRFTPVNAELIPTGELRDVTGTPFDFRSGAAIGARIRADDAQLAFGGGYDHNFALDGWDGARLAPAVRLRDPASGRTLEITTTEPGIQFYSGNYIRPGVKGKGAHAYCDNAGLALETQHFPNSPNEPSFPSTLLLPGALFRTRTVYAFGATS